MAPQSQASRPQPPIHRWPAEWEPLDAVWVVPPHNPETWPGCLDAAAEQHAAWCTAMGEVVTVRTTQAANIPTNDSWVRDFGPLFVYPVDAGGHDLPGQLVAQDFRFNGWGDKYEPRPLDDAAGAAIASSAGAKIIRHERILEGGALDSDGAGTLLTTTNCLLNPTRDDKGRPGERADIEAMLRSTLGITRTLWLDADLPGDDTDGHVDNAARFVAPGCVVVHPAIDPTPLHDAGLEVTTLPAADPLTYDYPPDPSVPGDEGGVRPLPASYANFIIANGRVFVPTFGTSSDDAALRLLDDLMPRHTPVPVRAEHLLVGLGALHCLSMQQPKVLA
ncbi:MAG: agmatine deiminase family protein [Algisphaera sp.]